MLVAAQVSLTHTHTHTHIYIYIHNNMTYTCMHTYTYIQKNTTHTWHVDCSTYLVDTHMLHMIYTCIRTHTHMTCWLLYRSRREISKFLQQEVHLFLNIKVRVSRYFLQVEFCGRIRIHMYVTHAYVCVCVFICSWTSRYVLIVIFCRLITVCMHAYHSTCTCTLHYVYTHLMVQMQVKKWTESNKAMYERLGLDFNAWMCI